MTEQPGQDFTGVPQETVKLALKCMLICRDFGALSDEEAKRVQEFIDWPQFQRHLPPEERTGWPVG